MPRHETHGMLEVLERPCEKKYRLARPAREMPSSEQIPYLRSLSESFIFSGPLVWVSSLQAGGGQVVQGLLARYIVVGGAGVLQIEAKISRIERTAETCHPGRQPQCRCLCQTQRSSELHLSTPAAGAACAPERRISGVAVRHCLAVQAPPNDGASARLCAVP